MSTAMQRRKLLILENDRALRRELEAVFSDLDVNGCEASDALATVRRTEPDAVLFDLGAAGEPAVAAQSLELLRQILNISPDTKIIAMTEHDARELSVAAVGLGATDFYHKPLDAGVLSIVVRRALRIRELEEENWRLRERTAGKLESAEGGTVFLDEIGEMPASLQAKLLRVVQERTVERVGGRVPVALDFRLVCATNRKLEALIGSGGFRDDLFYRISEVTIRVPPLRDRQGDSLLLAQFILQQLSERFGKPTRGLAPDAIRAIQAYRWPGNVRELENRIKGAVIMAEGAVVTASDLGLEDPGDDPEYLNLRTARQRAEAQAVRQALAVARGNLSRAAELLGVTRPTLYDLLGKHGIDAAQFGRHATQAPEAAPATVAAAAPPGDIAGG